MVIVCFGSFGIKKSKTIVINVDYPLKFFKARFNEFKIKLIILKLLNLISFILENKN